MVLMVDWDVHFTEHTIRRLDLPFYTKAGLTTKKTFSCKFGSFYLIVQILVYAFYSGGAFCTLWLKLLGIHFTASPNNHYSVKHMCLSKKKPYYRLFKFYGVEW